MAKQNSNSEAPLPWYSEGLSFKCTGCGDCCTGAPGYVWVNGADIALMAKETGLAIDEFERKYVRKVGVRKSLKELKGGDCIFFNNKSRKCEVYGARPRQCRTWPFWDSNLRTPEAWKSTCEICPGSGTGTLYELESIEAQRAVIRI